MKFDMSLLGVKKSTSDRYTNTRVRVMKSKLYREHDYDKMMRMSVDEITRFLQESKYKPEIDKMALYYSGINLVEYALNRNLANSFRRIYKFSISTAKQHIRAYLAKWDIYNIKTVLRGVYSETDRQEIFNTLVPAGELSEEFLREVAEKSANLDAAIEAFRRTPYYVILRTYSKDLTRLEDELDRHYYLQLTANLPDDVQDFIRMQIETINIVNEVRAQKGNIKFEPLPAGKKNGNGKKRSRFARKKAATKDIEKAMRAEMLAQSTKMLHEYRRNIKPIIGYFIAKKNEIRNIRLIVRGKQYALPQEMIEEHLVI